VASRASIPSVALSSSPCSRPASTPIARMVRLSAVEAAARRRPRRPQDSPVRSLRVQPRLLRARAVQVVRRNALRAADLVRLPVVARAPSATVVEAAEEARVLGVEAARALVHRVPAHRVPVHRARAHRVLVHRVPVHRVPVHRVPVHRVPVHKVPAHRVPVHRVPVHRVPLHRVPLHRLLARVLPVSRKRPPARPAMGRGSRQAAAHAPRAAAAADRRVHRIQAQPAVPPRRPVRSRAPRREWAVRRRRRFKAPRPHRLHTARVKAVETGEASGSSPS
jgi:hypothetical protein